MILGQNIPLRIVFNTLRRGYLHHSILLHGPDGVGKLSACINLAKTFFCKTGLGNICNRCEACLKVHLFRHGSVHVISNSDRMANVGFFRTLLEKGLSSHPKRISYNLVHEVAHLLYRHKMGFLERLKREKKSYPEGVRVDNKMLEEDLAETYGLLNDHTKKPNGINFLLRDKSLERLFRIQNGLDRTLLPKEGIEKAFSLLRQAPSESRRIVIIENLHDLNHNVVPMMLKILEEPPKNTQFLLTLGTLKDLPQAVVKPLQSRCLMLSFNRLTHALCRRILTERFGVETSSILPQPTPDLRGYFGGVANQNPNMSTTILHSIEALLNPETPLVELQKMLLESPIPFETALVAIGDYFEKRLDTISESDNHKTWHALRLVGEVRAMLKSKTFDEKNLSLRLILGIKNIA